MICGVKVFGDAEGTKRVPLPAYARIAVAPDGVPPLITEAGQVYHGD